MISINNKNLDEYVQSGETLVFLFYQNNHTLSDIVMRYLNELDAMVGKNFKICIVDASVETDVAEAFAVTDLPEIVVIKDKRIRSRKNKILYANQILKMLQDC